MITEQKNIYEIKILTPFGVKVLNFDESKKSLQQLEEETKAKFGTFITLESKKKNEYIPQIHRKRFFGKMHRKT